METQVELEVPLGFGIMYNILQKGDLILTGTYGFPVPIKDKKLIEVTSSAFGDSKATFN